MALPGREPGYRVPPGPPPRPASTPRTPVVDLGNGYSIVYLELAEGGPQIVKNIQPPGPPGPAAPRNDPDLYAKQAFEREQNAINLALQQARLAEDRRQYDETFGYQKARFNTEFPLQESSATGYYKGAPTLDRERFGEGQYQYDSTQAINYYKDLMNRASNPRNFVQSYFERRGFAAPADAAKYGNTAPGERPWTIGSLEQFLPGFLNTSRAARGGAPAQTRAAADPSAQTFQPRVTPAAPAATPAAPVFTPNGVTSGASVNLTTNNGITTPEPTLAATGVPGANSGQTFTLAQFGGKEPDWLRAALSGQAAKFANGGVIPEPVIGRGLISGRPYTFGEQGPEGVVPSNMLPDLLKRRGGTGSYALGGMIGYEGGSYDPLPPPPVSEPDPYSIPNSADFNVGMGGAGDFAWAGPPPAGVFDPPPAPAYEPAPLPPQPPQSFGGYPKQTTPFTISPEQQAYMDRLLAEQAAQNAARNTPVPTVQAPVTTLPPLAPAPDQRVTAGGPGGFIQEPPITQPTPTPVAAAPVVPVQPVTQPVGFVPQNGQTAPQFGQAPATPPPPGAPLPTNRDVSTRGTFGRSVPGAGPQFLPGEDQQSPLAMLAASGALPPFVSRLLGQAAGVQNQSTNTAQRFDLPADLPLISPLAYSQMLPSERAGLESLLSAYGIEPSDYFAMVEAYGPSGPRAESPLFGARLNPYRQ